MLILLILFRLSFIFFFSWGERGGGGGSGERGLILSISSSFPATKQEQNSEMKAWMGILKQQHHKIKQKIYRKKARCRKQEVADETWRRRLRFYNAIVPIRFALPRHNRSLEMHEITRGKTAPACVHGAGHVISWLSISVQCVYRCETAEARFGNQTFLWKFALRGFFGRGHSTISGNFFSSFYCGIFQ